jgi:hypothetical protein
LEQRKFPILLPTGKNRKFYISLISATRKDFNETTLANFPTYFFPARRAFLKTLNLSVIETQTHHATQSTLSSYSGHPHLENNKYPASGISGHFFA